MPTTTKPINNTQAMMSIESYQVIRVHESNYSRVRVIGRLRNYGPVTAKFEGVAASITGTDTAYAGLNGVVGTSTTDVVMDRTFNVYHDANGFRNVTFTFTVGSTGTEAFRTPGSVSVSYSLARIPKTPAKVGGVTLKLESPNTMVIGWQAPDNMGSSIIGYQVQWDLDRNFPGSPSTVGAGAQTTLRYSGFTLNRNWWFRVRAQNSVGFGPWSDPALYYVPDIPAPPRRPTLKLTPPNAITATTDWPANGGAAITSFEYSWANNPSFIGERIYTGLPVSYITVSDLTIGQVWYFRVRARNAQGVSGWSEANNYILNSGPRVHYNGQWRNSVAYVHYGGEWHLAIPYVHYNGEWRIAGG